MSCPQVTPTVFSVPRDLVSNRVIPHVSAHWLSGSEKRDSVKPFLPPVKSFADFTCLDFPTKKYRFCPLVFFYIAAFGQNAAYIRTRRGSEINPAILPVRTYALKHRETRLYWVWQPPQYRRIPRPADRRYSCSCCSIPDCTCSGWQLRCR